MKDYRGPTHPTDPINHQLQEKTKITVKKGVIFTVKFLKIGIIDIIIVVNILKFEHCGFNM